MSVSVIYDTYKGISNLIITDIETDINYLFPKPDNFSLVPGIQIRQTMTMSNLGTRVPSNQFPVGENPILSISYSHMQPEMIAFALGNTLVTGTFTSHIPKLLLVQQGQYPAAAVGILGNGVVVDAAAVASIIRNDVSVPLNRQPFAGYETWRDEDDNFGIGLNGALAFSDNIVTEKQVVALSIPYTGTMRKISDIVANPVRISATLVNNRNKVDIIEIPFATPDPSNVQISPGAESMEMRFFVNFLPGSCRAWELYALDDVAVTC